MKKSINLLDGSIIPTLTKLALPIMATSLIQMAYNLIDMIWIGRISSGAVAAVGAAGMYSWLASGLVMIPRVGGQIKVGHSLGAKDNQLARTYASNTFQIAIFMGILYGLVMLLFTKSFINFFHLNGANVINDANTYLAITCGLIIFSFINQVFTGLFTACGNSHTPFVATAIGLIINIILDPVLIFGFGPVKAMGVAGAAIATIFAQFIVMLVFLLSAKHEQILFRHLKVISKPSFLHSKQIITLGLPAGIQSMVFTGISMTISRMVAGYGDDAVAVQKVGSQIESISWMTAEGFAAAVNSFVAQNHGARQTKRVKQGYFTAMAVVMIWGVICTCLLIFLPKQIFQIFIPDTKVLPLGVDYLMILGFSQLFMCIEITTSGAFSGLGKTIPPSVIGIAFTSARIPMAYVMAKTALGLNGIWWSISISSIFKGLVLLTLFLLFLRKYLKNEQMIKLELQ